MRIELYAFVMSAVIIVNNCNNIKCTKVAFTDMYGELSTSPFSFISSPVIIFFKGLITNGYPHSKTT